MIYQDIYAGHSASAYLLGKNLATWPRILMSCLHFTTFYMILATTVMPFSHFVVAQCGIFLLW